MPTKKRKLTANTPDGLLVSRITHRDYKFVVVVRGKPKHWEMLRETYASGAKSNYNWAKHCLANPDIQNSFKTGEIVRICGMTLEEYQAESVARLEAKQKRNSWSAVGWSSRYDLAMKVVSGLNPELYEIYVAKVNEE